MWGCIGIRQDVSGFTDCNQGIALSPLRSVQRKLSANDFVARASKLIAKKNGWLQPSFAAIPVAA
jgi:hypothetical protein